MNDVLKGLAELLGVSKDTLQGVVDYMGSSLPDIISRVQKEAPLYIFLSSFNKFLVVSSIILAFMNGLLIVRLFVLEDDYRVDREVVNKTKKTLRYLLILFVISMLHFPLVQVVKSIFTPTVYTIDYMMGKLDNNK